MIALSEASDDNLRMLLRIATSRGDRDRVSKIKRILAERHAAKQAPSIVPASQPVRPWWTDND